MHPSVFCREPFSIKLYLLTNCQTLMLATKGHLENGKKHKYSQKCEIDNCYLYKMSCTNIALIFYATLSLPLTSNR